MISLYDRFNTYVHDKTDRGNTQIMENKLRDHILTIGCDKSNARDILNFLRDSFDGSLDLEELEIFLVHAHSNQYFAQPCLIPNHDQLFTPSEMHLRKLIKCTLMPCFLDSFLVTSCNDYYDLLWEKLFRFLLDHRLVASSLNEPYLENRIKVHDLRRRVLFEFEKELNELNSSKKISLRVD